MAGGARLGASGIGGNVLDIKSRPLSASNEVASLVPRITAASCSHVVEEALVFTSATCSSHHLLDQPLELNGELMC